MDLKTRIDIAAGRAPADLVLKNGQIVNVCSGEVHTGDLAIAGDRIVGIGSYTGRETLDVGGRCICPGFIDAHVHIESSLLSVPEYGRTVAPHGTTAIVADPHEIANVMGAEGVRYMLACSKYCPIHVFVMASSCVPASHFESAGAQLEAEDIRPLLADHWVLGLAEMMNYPGVIAGDPAVLAKLELVGSRPIDGHAPGLGGRDLCAYVASGIGSDHECTTAAEAAEKLRLGLTIMIREGSQAKNLDALLPLVKPDTSGRFLFCTDDKDVDDLLTEGHIDYILRRAVQRGLDPVLAVKMATLNAARYFGLHDVGALTPGRLANIAIVDDLRNFRVWRTYRGGVLTAAEGVAVDPDAAKRKLPMLRSSVNTHWLEPSDFAVRVPHEGEYDVQVMEVLENRIDTHRAVERVRSVNGELPADAARDLCKIAVVERHQASGKVGRAFVRGFGLCGGAIASTVGHDSHNLVVAGTSNTDMYAAAVHLVKRRGGFCVVRDGRVLADVPLTIGGLMSEADAPALSAQLRALHAAAKVLNCKLKHPFMALSFLTLSVIGALKVTDQGLVDVERFELIDLARAV